MTETKRLRPEERRFVEALLEPADNQTPAEIAERIGVTLRQYELFCRNRRLIQQAIQDSSLQAVSRLPRVLLVLAGKAEDGDLSAAKFLMQHAQEIGLVSMESEQMSAEEVVRVVRQIVEEQQAPPGEATP